MRAWQVHELGDPIDRMVLDEIDDPDVGPGRVVVDVEAVGLAFPDVLQCRGEYQVKPRCPSPRAVRRRAGFRQWATTLTRRFWAAGWWP